MKSPETWFWQYLVQSNKKENIEAPHYWIMATSSLVTGGFPIQSANNPKRGLKSWHHGNEKWQPNNSAMRWYTRHCDLQGLRLSTAPESLRRRHNGRYCVSNHQPHECLPNRFFGRRSKKTSNFRVTGLCAGKSPGTGEFPAQMAINEENASIWWRHHGTYT